LSRLDPFLCHQRDRGIGVRRRPSRSCFPQLLHEVHRAQDEERRRRPLVALGLDAGSGRGSARTAAPESGNRSTWSARSARPISGRPPSGPRPRCRRCPSVCVPVGLPGWSGSRRRPQQPSQRPPQGGPTTAAASSGPRSWAGWVRGRPLPRTDPAVGAAIPPPGPGAPSPRDELGRVGRHTAELAPAVDQRSRRTPAWVGRRSSLDLDVQLLAPPAWRGAIRGQAHQEGDDTAAPVFDATARVVEDGVVAAGPQGRRPTRPGVRCTAAGGSKSLGAADRSHHPAEASPPPGRESATGSSSETPEGHASRVIGPAVSLGPVGTSPTRSRTLRARGDTTVDSGRRQGPPS
jgi:hypothetical protein